MVDKQLFNKEVEEILEKVNDKTNLKEKLENAYDLSKKLHVFGEHVDRIEAHELVSEILEYLFKDKFSTSYSIPIEFIESEIGKVLFTLKYGLAEAVYTTGEITIILGKTRALISHDVKEGNVRASKKGRNIIMYERDLIQYMRSKNMSNDEVQMRLSLYSKLKEKGLNIKEIEIEFKKEINKLLM